MPESVNEIEYLPQPRRSAVVIGGAGRGALRHDVGLLVEFFPDARIGMIQYGALTLALSALMGRKVDLVTDRALRPALRDGILKQSRLLHAARVAVPRRNSRRGRFNRSFHRGISRRGRASRIRSGLTAVDLGGDHRVPQRYFGIDGSIVKRAQRPVLRVQVVAIPETDSARRRAIQAGRTASQVDEL